MSRYRKYGSAPPPPEEMGEKTDRDIQRLKAIVGKVSEQSKIQLDQMIQDFIAHPDLKEITFPNKLTNMERAYVHFQAAKHGLKSVSYGSGGDRRLVLRRATEKVSLETKSVELTLESLNGIDSLVFSRPEATEEQPQTNYFPADKEKDNKAVSVSRLAAGTIPKIPRPRKTKSFVSYQSRLPIWHHKKQILQAIANSRVVFIRGSTGCGKTTQVPQYILDHATENSKKVRIICTVPRRIAAISVSERVAQERGERLGQTVGYQIRLESCISSVETLLTYCTSGILLRSLGTADYAVLKRTTHIIIDEIHERDRQTDFLLACLKDILHLFPDLRLILMGADLNNELFSSYFGDQCQCPIIQVEGRLHPVQVYYLEDVLEIIKYENHEMRISKHDDEKASVYGKLVEKLCEDSFDNTSITDVRNNRQKDSKSKKDATVSKKVVDNLIRKYWTTGDDSAFSEFLKFVENQNISVNYQHSSVGVTMLMAAAVRGEIDYIRSLLSFEVDLNVKSKVGKTEFSAIDWATDYCQHEVVKLLLEHQYTTKLMPAINDSSMDVEKYRRLASYLRSIDEERVDLLLMLRLVQRIHMNANPDDAILVFLPGYDEIVTLKHLLMTDNQLGFYHGSFLVFMLHSNIQTGDQRAAFEKPPKGIRKIVLSTNIAESSLTIEDIVYVIDSGKAKEKSFDSLTSVTQLKSVWISKASVNQRRGRAGRCRGGVCYHLFSAARYESMAEFPIPEIVRTSLQELCLHARSFLSVDVKIEKFFSRIPEPPAPITVKKSVELLKVMGALDEDEQLTKLGNHLLDFPLEPFLGKALIYSAVFKCLDPILTLVSIISYRDPFQLPSDPNDKQKAQERRAFFAKESFSDHMAYLKSFQEWEKAKLFREGTEKRFCRENFLSSATFDMIYNIRAQLLGQLRASGFVTTKGKRNLTELNQNSSNWALVKGVLVATLYPNICGINRNKNTLYNSFNSKISFHPSTIVVKKKSDVPKIKVDWIIFDEMTQQGPANLVKGCTCVSTAAIALFAGSFRDQDNQAVEDDDEGDLNECESGMNLLFPMSKLKINQWITLHGSKEAIDDLVFLRQQINKLVLKRLEQPTSNFTLHEEAAIQTIAAVLVSEDKALGFKNVEGVGQWPKHVSGNFMSAPRSGYAKHNGTVECTPIPEAYFSSTAAKACRFFLVELDHHFQAQDILRSGLWLVPQFLKEQVSFNDDDERSTDDGLVIVVVFWVPSSKQFTGAIKLNYSELAILHEVPIQVVSPRVSSLDKVLRQIGIKIDFDVPMNEVVELEVDLARELLKTL